MSAAFPDPKLKARAIGIWTGIASVGLALGPTIGGVMTESLGWRSIFLVNVAIGALGILLVLLFVDESRDPTARSIDLPGQLLFIVAVGTLTYALIEGPHDGWSSPEILGFFAVALVSGIAFVLVELRSHDPMMDVRVFNDSVYTVAIVSLFAVMFSVYGLLLVITQYLQNVRGYSPETTGVIMLAFTVPTIVLAPIAGGLAARHGGRDPTLAGLTLLVAGLAVVIVGVGNPLGIVIFGLFLVGAAAGLAIAPTTNVAMASVPPDRAGMASGIMSAQRALGSTTGFAIMGSVLAGVIATTLPARFEPYLSQPPRQEVVDQVVEDANPRAVTSLIGPGKPLPDDVTKTDELVDAADDAFVRGMRVALIVGGVLTLGALIAGFFIFPRGTKDESADEAEATHLEVEESSSDR